MAGGAGGVAWEMLCSIQPCCAPAGCSLCTSTRILVITTSGTSPVPAGRAKRRTMRRILQRHESCRPACGGSLRLANSSSSSILYVVTGKRPGLLVGAGSASAYPLGQTFSRFARSRASDRRNRPAIRACTASSPARHPSISVPVVMVPSVSIVPKRTTFTLHLSL
jgi:hypothetical protein